jgi:RNA polymerase sigma-70 factor (ECF subfamily)
LASTIFVENDSRGKMGSPLSKLSAKTLEGENSGWPPSISLVVRAQNNVHDALSQLSEVCQYRIVHLVRRIVGDADAEDASQQVFVQMFRNLRKFEGESRFETWLYRLTVNECLQFRRHRSRRPCVSLVKEPVDHRVDHRQSAEHREMISQALEKLDPDLRTMFLLRELERLSYAAIAESLGIPEGTVASRLNRARRQLQTILADLGWEQ